MRFKVKQLMITVLPDRTKVNKVPGKKPAGVLDDDGCPGITIPPCHNTRPWILSWRDAIVDPAELSLLHEQLIFQLDKVEEKQKGVEDSMLPKSLADITMLEGQLQGALDDLKAQRAKLSQKTPVAKSK